MLIRFAGVMIRKLLGLKKAEPSGQFIALFVT